MHSKSTNRNAKEFLETFPLWTPGPNTNTPHLLICKYQCKYKRVSLPVNTSFEYSCSTGINAKFKIQGYHDSWVSCWDFPSIGTCSKYPQLKKMIVMMIVVVLWVIGVTVMKNLKIVDFKSRVTQITERLPWLLTLAVVTGFSLVINTSPWSTPYNTTTCQSYKHS